MVRFLLALALLVSVSACAKSPEELSESATAYYEQGKVAEAIEVLEKSDPKNYVVGNSLAYMYARQAYFSQSREGAEKAIRILDEIELPAHGPKAAMRRYLDLLKFDALSSVGRSVQAAKVLEEHCPASLGQIIQKRCLRQILADPMLSIGNSYGEGSRTYRELLKMSQAAYVTTFGWDPRAPLPDEI